MEEEVDFNFQKVEVEVSRNLVVFLKKELKCKMINLNESLKSKVMKCFILQLFKFKSSNIIY